MIYYKIDILKELKNKNLTTYTLKKDNKNIIEVWLLYHLNISEKSL